MATTLGELAKLVEGTEVPFGKECVVDRPCSHRHPQEGSLVLVKDESRWKEFRDSKDLPSRFALMFSDLLWNSLKDDKNWNQWSEKLQGVLVTPQFDLSMARNSKPFYDEATRNLNSSVDGRQSGSAEVYPSALIGRDCFIGEGVSIGENVVIHPHVVIMGPAKIGDGCELFPHVSIYPFTEIGANCRLHSHVVVGSDGFGYQFENGVHEKVWHYGGVKIGRDVEIGPNSCVDAGSFSSTTIGEGTKIDNHVQVAHNCHIGKGVILCGQVGLSGSITIGDFCVVGGKAGFAPGIEVGQACQIAGNAMVTTSLKDGSVVGGHPARPLREWLRFQAKLKKLVEASEKRD